MAHFLTATDNRLNEGQKAAVRHALGSRDPVTIIRGAAGTGKTTLENELRLGLEEAGVPVAAIAQSTGAVEELRNEAGFAGAVTIAHFLRDTKMQASIRGGLVLVDEASQVGTKDMLRLFDVVREAGARIGLVGDKQQHRSVSAGEPLRLLEQRAGLPVVQVTDIVRQSGDYRKAAHLLSEGRVADGFAELDRLQWIREVPDAERYQQLAAAYLAATREKKRGGKTKSTLVVSPTHGEGARITGTIRAALKAEGKLGEERTLATWASARLTDPEKADAANYDPGDMLQFHQNAPGQKNGSRLVVAEGKTPPVAYADRYEVYRPSQLTLAIGDRGRITANGWTKEGKHRLANGALFTVKGFTPQGDVVTDSNWIIARDFGHLAHGYVVTSHAAQGKTVDKVFIGQSSLSFGGASNRRQFYVSVSRGREQALVFTSDKKELLKAVQRADEPLSATEFAEGSGRNKPTLLHRLKKHLAFRRRQASFERTHARRPAEPQRMPPRERERDRGHAR